MERQLEKSGQIKTKYQLPVNRGEEKVVMHCGHSMFMNYVSLTKNDLGPDVLAKIHSVVCNTLFKSAKFYPSQVMPTKWLVSVCITVGFGRP